MYHFTTAWHARQKNLPDAQGLIVWTFFKQLILTLSNLQLPISWFAETETLIFSQRVKCDSWLNLKSRNLKISETLRIIFPFIPKLIMKIFLVYLISRDFHSQLQIHQLLLEPGKN